MTRILNKRNAIVGWVAWLAGKRVLRRHAAQRRRSALIVVGAGSVAVMAAAAASFAVWHRRTPAE